MKNVDRDLLTSTRAAEPAPLIDFNNLAFAKDAKKFDDPVWAPIFEGFKPVNAWLRAKAPEVLVYIYNDHMTSFFMDHYSHFALRGR